VTDGTPGEEFDFEPFMTALLARLSALDDAPVRLALTESDPQVTRDEAVSLTDDAVAALARAPYALTLDDGRSWIVTGADLASMLVPFREMGPVLDVDEAAFDAFVDPIAAEVETEARNARFSVDGGRVSEFVGSQDGLSVNRGELKVRLLAAARGEGEAPIIIPTSVVEPDVTTEEANDLGITDVLGVGTSSYRGSPANRVKNIRNGVNLLNGLLIAPDETFSLLAALKPFETDNGYLPELVIKGDKIQPEIGGGLCQIGTTSFRAAMNSGLPVVQRSNHSLVVSYYNDPSNGNPGTDATIYDPAPDFQFKNDTGRYVLFQAEMNEDDASLAFTLWGTSDGRIGSYTPPEVTRWIGVGETVRTETLDLEPGVTKCQSAHVGADTTFTYRVVKTDGSVEERTFESHYRPLPEICLVGVEELSTRDDLPADADGVSSTQATDVPVEADDALPPAAQTETE
jgi:vancomycin resistance protein YoaR